MNKERKNLLVFGYGLALILTFIAIRLWIKHGLSQFKIVLLVIAVGLFLVTLLNVELIKPFYKKWMTVAHFIGECVSKVVLSIIFYLVFSVAGVLLRLLGKDLLDEKIQPDVDSYWLPKKPDSYEDKYKRQF